MMIEATVVTLAIPTFLIVLAKAVAFFVAAVVVVATIVGFFYPSN